MKEREQVKPDSFEIIVDIIRRKWKWRRESIKS
jgi:hypothetical protein